MNILVDSCAYSCQNVGDMAMLRVAVSRLRELWPRATLQVITDAPDRVAALCGEVVPIPVHARRHFLEHRLFGRGQRLIPEPLANRWGVREQQLRSRYLGLWALAHRLKLAIRGKDAGVTTSFLSAVRDADLLVVSGAGVLTDAFKDNALGILATLEMAQQQRTPTAMFSQGVGPIADAEIRARAATVLPRVRLIAVRERRATVEVLRSLGVSPHAMQVTGDDALELVLHTERAVTPRDAGVAIGVNIRVAPYAGVDATHVALIREALTVASRAYGATLVPIAIAHRDQTDAKAISELLGCGPFEGPVADAVPDTPRGVIEAIGGCRLVVTGSYHAAVFALGQGIPAVALASSQYYISKMVGLADQFGEGCYCVRLDRTGATPPIADSIARAWEAAESLRPRLLSRAQEQVTASRAAYITLKRIIGP